MLSSRLKSMPPAAQLLLILGAVLLLAAAGIHTSSDLPRQYSWSRTLELFWQAIIDAYFMVMALIVLLAARLQAPPGGTTTTPWRLSHFLFAGTLTVGVACLLLSASTSYTVWDRASIIPVALLLLHSLRDRDLPVALLGLSSTVCILMLVSYVFTVFKSQLFVTGIILDEWLIAGERMIFGQPLYLTIARWAERNPLVVHLSDWVYYLFFHHMALVALFLFARGEQGEQWRYVATLSLCYLLGGLSYYLFPAFGPVYYDPGAFAYLKTGAVFTADIQSFLWQATNASMHGTLTEIDTFAFIACMPSLHMAHESIMFFYSRRAPLMLVFSGLFWCSSIVAVLVLGWHYLFDVVGGVVLAGIVIAAVRYRRPAVIVQD
ncbi:MAG: phosphatase PAP2 family protein [Candidatus Accumulibacter phosphatis]|uniref:phosphatase PAP2 family protein n=1 Tax=Candidatus Accumulibacter phosphatis TaxID=327160 RepID=UPI001A3C3B66|nr:phosphatase PAP2 family protein [Candidatus Accumulibacter phosphatis]